MTELNQVHGGNVHYFSRKLGLSIDNILDYSANINPLGYPQIIKTEIEANFDSILNYPDINYHDLTEAISNFFHIPSENILLGNGAVELIYLLLNHLKPKNILIPVPTFSEYGIAAKTVKANINYLYLNEEDNWNISIEKITKQLANNQLLFICNPNNPTGNLLTYNEIQQLAKNCAKEKVMLVIDESFMGFLHHEEKYSLRKMAVTSNNIVILSSLTKLLGIPGLRIGFQISHANLTKTLKESKDPWNVNCFAEIAARTGLTDNTFISQTKDLINVEKEFVYSALKNMPTIKPFEPTVNFILVKILKKITAAQLAEKMAARGILIRNCSNFIGLSEQFFRLAIKDREKNIILIETLKSVLEEE